MFGVWPRARLLAECSRAADLSRHHRPGVDPEAHGELEAAVDFIQARCSDRATAPTISSD